MWGGGVGLGRYPSISSENTAGKEMMMFFFFFSENLCEEKDGTRVAIDCSY